jgi:hypothetical protein
MLLTIGVLQADSPGHKGLNIAFGIGSGVMKTTYGLESDSDNQSAVFLSRIGAGITNNMVLIFEGIGNYGSFNYTSFGKKDVSYNYAGIGMNYYFNENATTPYIGFSFGTADHESDPKSFVKSSGTFGNSYKLSAGYEYNRWLAEVNYIKASSEIIKTDSVIFAIGYNFALLR